MDKHSFFHCKYKANQGNKLHAISLMRQNQELCLIYPILDVQNWVVHSLNISILLCTFCFWDIFFVHENYCSFCTLSLKIQLIVFVKKNFRTQIKSWLHRYKIVDSYTPKWSKQNRYLNKRYNRFRFGMLEVHVY